jgi:ACS family allantoate permease-like MFS transporter
VLVLRNRRLDKVIATDGLTEEARALMAKKMGEEDKTDFENPYFRYTL